MTGYVSVKGGKYYAVLNLYVNGERKKKWICTQLPEKGNKRKAEQFLRDKIIEYERMSGLIQTDVTFSDYIRYWLVQTARKVDDVTLQGYKVLAEKHILPYFDDKDIKLLDVDWKVLQDYIDYKHKFGKRNGSGGLSPRSLKLHKNILNQALSMAVKNNHILTNPCQFVTLPQIVPYESKYYTSDQIRNLFEKLHDDPMLPVVKITAIYGLRRSELLGLQWSSIDFDAKTMLIRHTVVKVNRIVEKDKTKNASSHRIFPLTDETIEIFKQMKNEETLNRKLYGSEYVPNDYVFKWPNGKPYSPDYITHRFNDLLKIHNLPHIRFHELRHSCASILLSMGWSLKDIQEWLGHSDIKMTANIYSHLDTTRKNSIASAISGSLGA